MTVVLNAGKMKLMFNGVGILLLVQLIYFFDASIGWIHMPLFVLYLITVDIYREEFRNYKVEMLTLACFSVLALLIMVNSNESTNLALLAKLCLLTVTGLCMQLVYKTFNNFKCRDKLSFINNNNTRLIEKKTNFMPVFCILIEVVLVSIVVQIFLKI